MKFKKYLPEILVVASSVAGVIGLSAHYRELYRAKLDEAMTRIEKRNADLLDVGADMLKEIREDGGVLKYWVGETGHEYFELSASED